MKDPHKPPNEHDAALAEENEPEGNDEGDPMRALLKRSLGAESVRGDQPEILRGVQKKIRQRSKGKFYGDGWSTTESKVNYLIIALVMLVLIGVVYFALGPSFLH